MSFDYTWSLRAAQTKRCDGTGSWFFKYQKYSEWENELFPTCLWFSGSGTWPVIQNISKYWFVGASNDANHSWVRKNNPHVSRYIYNASLGCHRLCAIGAYYRCQWPCC
jgi:hypothetical protein